MNPVTMESFDVKRIREIARLQGKDPDNLSDAEVWNIVSEALILYWLETQEKRKIQET